MIYSEEARWSEIFSSHPVAGRVTAKNLSKALQGFPLQPIRDVQWLARAIQPAVYLAANQRLPAKGPADVRDELEGLASEARALCIRLFDISDAGEEALWLFARSLPGASDDSANEKVAAYEQSWERLGGFVAFLDQAAAHAAARAIAQATASTGPSNKWNRAADKDWRKWFAVWLSPAFEDGFGRRTTLNNEASGAGRHKHGHWADFYERIMGMAFQRPAENIGRVLREAGQVTRRKRTAAGVVRFPAGWFPE